MRILPKEIQALIDRDALFIVNHSGGADSQAMTIFLQKHVASKNLIIVYADLGSVVWEGTKEHITKQHPDIPLYIARAKKTFFDMVHHRKMFPSPQYRQCTSDLKRNPLEVLIRWISKTLDRKLIVNCQGLRAEESPNRKKKENFIKSEKLSAAGREVYEWLPIQDELKTWCFDTIREAGQEPHWVYGKGMKRCSCKICIFSSEEDIKLSAELDPENAQEYMDAEELYDFTMIMPKEGKRRFIKEILQN